MSLIVRHNLQDEYGVPAHIIFEIMASSFDNYCVIFRNLEKFYMEIEKAKQEDQFEADMPSASMESPRM